MREGITLPESAKPIGEIGYLKLAFLLVGALISGAVAGGIMAAEMMISKWGHEFSQRELTLLAVLVGFPAALPATWLVVLASFWRRIRKSYKTRHWPFVLLSAFASSAVLTAVLTSS